MTRRERLEMIIRGEINDELIEECKRELEKLDAHRTHARENANAQENKEYEERICAALRGMSEPVQIDELAELVGCTFARQRLTAICTNLIREGRIHSCDIKFAGTFFSSGPFEDWTSLPNNIPLDRNRIALGWSVTNNTLVRIISVVLSKYIWKWFLKIMGSNVLKTAHCFFYYMI